MGTIEGMTTTSNTGSPLVTYSRAKRAKRKAPGQDVENAADARKPGDAAEDTADGASNFIKGAIKRPGSLHSALNVAQSQRIPASKVAAAANSSNPNLRRKAQLAKTLKAMTKK